MYSKPLTPNELIQRRIERIEQKLNLPPIQAMPGLTGRKTKTPHITIRDTKKSGHFVEVHSQDGTDDTSNISKDESKISVKDCNASIESKITFSDNVPIEPALVWGDPENRVDVIDRFEVDDAIDLEFKDFKAQGKIVKIDPTRHEIIVRGEFTVASPDDGAHEYHRWFPFRPGIDKLLDRGTSNRPIAYELVKSGLLGGTQLLKIHEPHIEGIRPGLVDLVALNPSGDRREISFMVDQLRITNTETEAVLRPLIKMPGGD